MWNSHNTSDHVGVHAEIITFAGGNGDEIHAYSACPVTDPVASIVLVHHAPGWDEFYQEFAERLARHGYDVLCPNLYNRYGEGTPDDIAAKARGEGGVPDASVVADCTAALAWLKSRKTRSGKVGIIGTCSGGRHSLLVASTVPGFDAIVDCWGGGVALPPADATPARPVAPITYTKDLNIPLLGLFGNDDQGPSPDQVNLHEEELKKQGKNYEFHRYDGAGHGFFYYHDRRYRQEQAMDGWSHIFRFFADNLS